ncbi:MAG: hypothetical protein M1827_005567 [Pycnora praestabilis]|nr:MAG: hypothetical protein M1827_005567 [Pycnora praestabilis]
MFQSFTGNSRRTRQVNLSGRNANPFAAAPNSGPTPAVSGKQNALASAQQERILRQRERDRLNGARVIQRTWRGHNCRKKVRSTWRYEWDQRERFEEQVAHRFTPPRTEEPQAYTSEVECVVQLRLLVQFTNIQRRDDVLRLDLFARRLLNSGERGQLTFSGEQWTVLLWKLQNLALEALESSLVVDLPVDGSKVLQSLLIYLTSKIPKETARNAKQYYHVLANATKHTKTTSFKQGLLDRALLLSNVLGPLRALNSETLKAYEGFASEYLTVPHLERYISLEDLVPRLNYKLLARSLASLLKAPRLAESKALADSDSRIWLLAYFVSFHELVYGRKQAQSSPEPDYVAVVSILLSSLADEIGSRIDIEDLPMERDLNSPILYKPGQQQQALLPLPPFVRKEILSLVNQQSITSLLAQIEGTSIIEDQGSNSSSGANEEARLLASYALTLLRVFPRRGDEIRMWLYLGSTSIQDAPIGDPSTRIPAIKYFWRSARNTTIYESISRDSRAALILLRHRPLGSLGSEERNQEWRIILLFLELYAFVLKVMDDEEFFSGGTTHGLGRTEFGTSWTRESALPLVDVKLLTIFLKNLAFTMYWNASDIADVEERDTGGGIGNYFSTSNAVQSASTSDGTRTKHPDSSLAGISGMDIDYVKGIVTGLLRMVYERDSRRNFLPKDHWLMTARFDMEGFIPAVVVEEENRHRVQEADEEDDEPFGDLGDDDMGPMIIGNRRTQQTRNIETLKRQQRKASRKKYLEAVTPRLEILQNMPFFIPFSTRVQIFREFVTLDQTRRRGGHVDPDNWRMSIMQNPAFQRSTAEGRPSGHDIISRHHAKIRRESVFEDAYAQFYDLGEGLKEPIQITFIDKFDTVEAGIDGGGVTKEFLTSVTNEAFSSSNGLNLFVENDQNLLYPNPAAVDERKDLLRQAGFKDGSPDWNEQMRELLKRYEFLGRVMGKCLYEGILVDVGFAGFFLLKWALTGGSGSASRESGYRANLNDLRDLDEGLYQGLLQLKNYSGDVEDFSLNFTVTDIISTPQITEHGTAAATKTITRDLKPKGSDIPVTNENRLVYISYIARHRLQIQPHQQTSAFLRGLSEVIQPSWLSMFNQSELQTLVGGDSSEIDVPDLRRNTLYGGVYTIGDDHQEHPSIQLFWDVMSALNDSERRKVLKFVTSTPRAPLLGFGQLNPRFSIRDAGNDQERLPSTSTCVNLLKLPRYADATTLRDKLLYAVNSGAGFDLS